MFPPEHVVTVTVDDGAGGGDADSPLLSGRVWQIRYEKHDFADGVDFTITTKTGGVVLWDEDNVNASKTVRPRIAVQDSLGADATLDGTRLMREPAIIYEEAIHIAVAQGGADGKHGKFYLTVG